MASGRGQDPAPRSDRLWHAQDRHYLRVNPPSPCFPHTCHFAYCSAPRWGAFFLATVRRKTTFRRMAPPQ